jgi:hypothetical protein
MKKGLIFLLRTAPYPIPAGGVLVLVLPHLGKKAVKITKNVIIT